MAKNSTKTTSKEAEAKEKAKAKAKSTFHDHLIASRWLLALLGIRNVSKLRFLDNDEYEGLNEQGETRFLNGILGERQKLAQESPLSEDELRRYDLNIVQHWQQITERRNREEGHRLHLKYFQYLSLLCAEIYLDWYFNRREQLLTALNATLAEYKKEKYADENLPEYTEADLNKAAFWNATGSGKTLLMHVNILQYRAYHKGKIDNLLVLTPNEDLSEQHFKELKLSGFLNVSLFIKPEPRDTNDTKDLVNDAQKVDIQIIDIHKLGDKSGEKTENIEKFAGNNLVLVDEGHSGASGEEWLKRRKALISQGFAFEYSATFGQVAGNGTVKKKSAIFETYAKAVLFDYSYKFFYEDGYGKEHLILNMAEKQYQDNAKVQQYLTACLLSFYQQLWLLEEKQAVAFKWNIAKPLWVFVGRTVNKESEKEKSDIRAVVDFFAYFLNHRASVEKDLAALINNVAAILDEKNNSIFSNRFTPLNHFNQNISALYDDILKRVFHADSVQRLKLEKRSRKEANELVLRVGNQDPFGVINIGDVAGFFKTAQEDLNSPFDTLNDDLSGSLFDGINDHNSSVNVLIGSKKFSEGWSSWRVSTMGLLNMGQSEGPQIIQLFGRGVRLKGRGFSLKRSKLNERPQGIHLEKLETLNIFGINAGYMDEFKKYLKEEGITPSDEILTIDFSTKPRLPTNIKLTTLRLKEGYKDNQINGFKRKETAWLFEIPAKWQSKLKAPHAELDCYPRVRAFASNTTKNFTISDQREKGKLNHHAFALFDWDAIYLALWDYKLKNSYSNMRLDKAKIRAFAEKSSWYTLYIPPKELEIHTFADVLKQQKLLIELLQLYCSSFYNRLKGAYEGQFYETVAIDDDHRALKEKYHIQIDPQSDDREDYQHRLNELKSYVKNGEIKQALSWKMSEDLHVINIEQHLYYPLIKWQSSSQAPLTIRPIPLQAESELKFVKDLQAVINSDDFAKWTNGKDIYLLRNPSHKSKGVGFALAGNFYPDFLLWLVDRQTSKQWLTFIDPKGLLHLNLNDTKIGLSDEIKKLEKTLNAPNLTLNSVILSITDFDELRNTEVWSEEKLREKNVLFMNKPDYLKQLFELILNGV